MIIGGNTANLCMRYWYIQGIWQGKLPWVI